MYKKKYLKYKLKYLNLKNKLYGGSEESRKTISDRDRKKCLKQISDRKRISDKSKISRKFLKQAIEKSWQDTHPEELYDEKLDNWMSEFDEKGKEEGEEAVWRSLGDDAYWRRLDEEAVRRDFGEEKGEEDEVSKGELLPSQPTKPRPPNMKTYSGERQQCRYIHEQNLREKKEEQAKKNPAFRELYIGPKSEPCHQPEPPPCPPPCPPRRTLRKRNPIEPAIKASEKAAEIEKGLEAQYTSPIPDEDIEYMKDMMSMYYLKKKPN